MSRLRGLFDLLRDAVDQGSLAIQRVQLEISRRPFEILEQAPGIDAPARVVRLVHDLVVAQTYGSVRLVNGLTHLAAGMVINAVEARRTDSTDSSP
jgi:hypothetical protein